MVNFLPIYQALSDEKRFEEGFWVESSDGV